MTDGSNAFISGTDSGAALTTVPRDPAQVRQLMQQRDALKANILSLALQESDTSETLMKFLQDNGLWDLVTAPGGDQYHTAQFNQAQNTINTSYTGDITP